MFLDGVEMALIKSDDGNRVDIVYGQDIPVHLRELGVTAGTILVRGQWEENILIGEAYAFSKSCGPISYAVRAVVDYGGSLLVFGPVPTSCKVDDYANYSWGKDAIMRFDQPQMEVAKRAERERKGKKTRRAEQPKPKEQAKRQPTPAPSASRVARSRAAPAPVRQPQQQQQPWPSYPQWWR